MKIRNQLFLNNGLILSVLLVVAGTMYRGVSSLVEAETGLSHTQEVITRARQLAKYAVDMETGQRGFMLTGKEEFLEPFILGRAGFEEIAELAIALVADDPSQVVRFQRLRRLHSEWVESSGNREIELRRRVDLGELPIEALTFVLQGKEQNGRAIPSYRKSGKQRMDELRQLVTEVIEVEQALLDTRAETNRLAADQVQSVAIFGALLAFLLSGSIGWFLSRRLMNQLGAEPEQLRAVAKKVALGVLTEEVVVLGRGSEGSEQSVAVYVNGMIETFREAAAKADEIAQGNFKVRINLRSDEDVLGTALERMTLTLRDATEQNAQERWIKTGQNDLANVVRGEADILELSRAIVTQVAKYVGAEVGALYTVSTEGLRDWGDVRELYRLTGTYAYTHRKALSSVIAVGEGLVGQAILEKQVIALTDLPVDYIEVSSGLGRIVPSHLVLVPLIHEGRVLGVLELGALACFSDAKMSLLSLIASSSAVALNTAFERGRMEVLLAETQEQAEKLADQQDALQISNSSLEAQAEVLKNSEESLTVSNEELTEKGEILKQQAANLERQKLELQEQKDQLAQGSSYKSEFLSNMSHELRTPLNSMLILSKSLAENAQGNLTPDQVEAAEVVHSGGAELLTLINEILDLSKIEAGRMDITWESLEIEQMVSGLRRQFAPLAEEKTLKLEVKLADSLQASLYTDGHRLRQILKNLLSNAIKFTNDGSVSISLDYVVPPAGEAWENVEQALAIRVKDSGIGVPEARRTAIFEAFQQVDGSTSRKYGGTGLGLTISRRLAHLLGGDLVLEESTSRGSTFTLYLPAAQAPSACFQDFVAAPRSSSHKSEKPSESSVRPQPEQVLQADEKPASSKRVERSSGLPEQGDAQFSEREAFEARKNKKVLLVDDDARNLFALSKVLVDAGLKIDCATNGKLALQKLDAQPDIDIVLMDVMMPVMNGLEAMRAIRAIDHFHDLPLIALTAQVMAGSKAECLDAGANTYLPKPIDTDELLEAIDTLLWERSYCARSERIA